jgi:hypothetical protein
MADPAGESNDEVLKLDFDRRLMLQFRGSVVTSDAELLTYRELNDALGLSTMAGETLADARTGKNGRRKKPRDRQYRHAYRERGGCADRGVIIHNRGRGPFSGDCQGA